MFQATYYSLVIFVPVTHSRAIREALVSFGAGRQGNYDSCSFSVVGVGRFRPLAGSTPTIGKVGVQEVVAEERIETDVHHEKIVQVLKAVRAAHPYEQPGIHVTPLMDLTVFERGISLSPRDTLGDLHARVASIEENMRETLAGLASDMAVWQTAAKAQIEDVNAAAMQTRRRREVIAAVVGTPPHGSSAAIADCRLGTETRSQTHSRSDTGDGATPLIESVAEAAQPYSGTPLKALENRLMANVSIIFNNDRGLLASSSQPAAAAAGGSMPTLSLVAPRPYSATKKLVLEDHSLLQKTNDGEPVSLQMLKTPPRSSPDPSIASLAHEGFV